MSSVMRKPLNLFESPVFPNITAALPQFKWSKKHWQVEPGRVLLETDNIPQTFDNGVLYQNYNYNTQYAYGKFPTYDVVVNDSFRPPPIDRDDVLPLSRIPRPLIIPHLNPGTAFPSGGSSFVQQNMSLSGVEKYISDRVKEGEARPTFFAPIDMPVDNSVLPDLQTKLPPTSASAGFNFGPKRPIELTPVDLKYKQFHPEVIAGVTPIPIDAPSYMQDLELDYNNPQISAAAGVNTRATPGLTPVNFDLDYNNPQISATAGIRTHSQPGLTPVNFDLEYNNPQISATAGIRTHSQPGLTPVNFDLGYNNPQISATAGINTRTQPGLTPIDYDFEQKLEGNQPVSVTPHLTPIAENAREMQPSSMHISDARHTLTYVVPHNTPYQSRDIPADVFYRRKAQALEASKPQSTPNYIPRRGIDVQGVRLKTDTRTRVM